MAFFEPILRLIGLLYAISAALVLRTLQARRYTAAQSCRPL
jgi:hypothetical protein